MGKLSVLYQKTSVGAEITLYLVRGDDVSGVITELTESLVSISQGDRIYTYFDDLVAGWKVGETENGRTLKPPVLADIPPETQPEAAPSATPEPTIKPTSVPSVTPLLTEEELSLLRDTSLVAQKSRIVAAYAQATPPTPLPLPKPDFSFPLNEFPIERRQYLRTEWEKIHNQYNYATKVREPERCYRLIKTGLLPLAKEFPRVASIRALIGALLLELEQLPGALEQLQAAALLADSARYWRDLAAAGVQQSDVQCYALKYYFTKVAVVEDTAAWRLYSEAALMQRDGPGLAKLLDNGLAEPDNADVRRLLLETLVVAAERFGLSILALQATASLNDTAVELSDGWQDLLTKVEPQPELLSLERKAGDLLVALSKPGIVVEPKPPSPSIRRGRIKSFGSQQFGFIESSAQETIFFGIIDVADDGLRQALYNGTWRLKPEVEYTVEPSPGHKYPRAKRIVPRQGATAQPVVAPKQLAPVPIGANPYARAKRAQLRDGDLAQAEKLFREAIKAGDNTESAVKDLATLLQQLGRLPEAIELLELHHKRQAGSQTNPYDNVLATMYQQSDRHKEAIAILERLAKNKSGKERLTVLRRISLSYFHMKDYSRAEKTLNSILAANPNDAIALRWLGGLEEARRVGDYSDAEEIFSDLSRAVEEGIALSAVAKAAIENCEFEGVNPKKLREGKFDQRDIEELEELAKRLGTSRPRQRAAFYLSAAAILKQFIPDQRPGYIYEYLRRYFVSMGEAAWLDMRAMDVVRTYYLESLALVSIPDLGEAWRTLARYLASFAPESRVEIEKAMPTFDRGDLSSPERQGARNSRLKVIDRALGVASPELAPKWVHAMQDLCSQSRFAANIVRDAIRLDAEAKRAFASHLNLSDDLPAEQVWLTFQERYNEHSVARRRHINVCNMLTRHQLTAVSIQNLTEQLRRIDTNRLLELDTRRLREIIEIGEETTAYCLRTDIDDREQQYFLISRSVDRFGDQILADVTQLSFEALLPVAQHLKSLVEESYAQDSRELTAELKLRLLADEYVAREGGEVLLKVQVGNRAGRSAASNIKLTIVQPDHAYITGETEPHSDAIPSLRGGATQDVRFVLRASAKAVRERAFPIRLRAQYRNGIGEDCESPEQEWSVKLYDETEFEEIDNPYRPYADGGEVDDPDLFFGRGPLLQRLENALLSGFRNKCIVMFGQKRTGKSSVLEHLRRRLRHNHPECIVVKFSLLVNATNLTESMFLHRILQEIGKELADLRYEGRDVPVFDCPDITHFGDYPALRFTDLMDQLTKNMRRNEQWSHYRFVLLIDEFTEIYKQIRKGFIMPEFMKVWKAIIEKKYFASVLVGQDIMPAFKQEFPNEFGVTEDERITYLSPEDATKLIEVPIGKHHYAGGAIPRMLDLTAGSPFYTMSMCSRVVEYMNTSRSLVVTKADINWVESTMISGDHRLTREKFENLYSAGDGVEDTGIVPEHALLVCRQIARKTERNWCEHQALIDWWTAEGRYPSDLNAILEDLTRRDVVERTTQERRGDCYRIIVQLFHDWLLVHS